MPAVTASERVIRASGRASRRLHRKGLVPRAASGGVRLVAGKLANTGRYDYQNQYGHSVSADLSDYMERIGFFGAHGSHIIGYLTSCLQPGDWAIDVGANVGLVTSPMAAAVGAGGCVWAIEPLPRNILRLRALKDDNELTQLTVVPVALGARESTGRLRLSSRPGGSGSGSFVAPWARPEHVEVEIARLDDLVAARAPARPLRLLKVDVEGFEAEFLAGAEATLTTHRPLVICEFHDPLLRAAGSSSEELLKAFARYRYHPRAPFARPTGPLHDTVVDMLLCPS